MSRVTSGERLSSQGRCLTEQCWQLAPGYEDVQAKILAATWLCIARLDLPSGYVLSAVGPAVAVSHWPELEVHVTGAAAQLSSLVGSPLQLSGGAFQR